MKTKELDLHKTCAAFLDWALPPDACWFHVPNGEKRSKATAAKLKAMGVKPGVPDICVIYRGRAIFAELKRPKGGVPSADQIAMHQRLAEAGVPVCECRSLDELAAWVRFFMPLRASVAA